MPIVHKESSIEPPLQSRPWAELPAEITMDILQQRLGTIEIVESAQRVCSTWWKVCHDPAMWRVIDLKYDPDLNRMPLVLERICRIVVDRSQGQLLKISIEKFGSRDLLNYIAERSSQLRHLRFVKCDYAAGSLVTAAKNLPLLEELHTHLTIITEEDIESVGRYCPLLKSFTLNASKCTTIRYSLSPDDGQVLAIARSMPELRHLALILNPLTDVGLQAILDGCPHLGRRCRQQIVDLKQPHASSQDYEFNSEVCCYIYYSSSDDYEVDFEYAPSDDHKDHDYEYFGNDYVNW